MTSIYSADPVYYPEGPSVPIVYSYRENSVMDFLFKQCPAFALCAQKAALDREMDAPEFESTCFVPSRLYANKYLAHFERIDVQTARSLVRNSTLNNRVDICHLRTQEFLPTLSNDFMRITLNECGYVCVNGLPIRQTVYCSNGIVHVLDGCLSMTENFLD